MLELGFISAVAPFDLAVVFRTALGNAAMHDAEFAERPSEVSAEVGAMVGLDPLSGCWESAAQSADEVGRRADRVVRIDPKGAVPRRFVNAVNWWRRRPPSLRRLTFSWTYWPGTRNSRRRRDPR